MTTRLTWPRGQNQGKLDKVVELVSGGSGIKGAILSSFYMPRSRDKSNVLRHLCLFFYFFNGKLAP